MSGSKLWKTVAGSYNKRSYEYLKRSAQALSDGDHGWKKQLPLYSFSEISSLNEWVLGCDADIGGKSSAYWGQTRY
jgi:hypothetical protein